MATVNKIDLNGDTYDIESSALVTTQPTTPTEWAVYYDTTNDVVKVYDGTNWNVVWDDAADINTKTFYLSSTSDLTTAQAAYDWWAAGKNPIIRIPGWNYSFILEWNNSEPTYHLGFYWVNGRADDWISNSYIGINPRLELRYSSDIVTSVVITTYNAHVLFTDVNYSTPYTPTYNGSPATKKYVDDSITWLWLWTAATKDTWTSSWNVPVLDSNWHLANSTIPWVALTDTFTVSTSSDLTTLSSADQWDIAIVSGENKTYVLSVAPYSTASNWKQILSPTGWVTSVNGQTWAVTLSIPTDTSDLTNWAGYLTSSTWVTSFNWNSWAITYTAPVTSVNNQTWDVILTIPSVSTIQVTLTAANWSSKSITVTATWVTASNTVIVSPAPANINDYATNSIYCSAQGSGTLTFSCNTEPTGDIDVNVLIMS